jgi:hypothetical protein
VRELGHIALATLKKGITFKIRFMNFLKWLKRIIIILGGHVLYDILKHVLMMIINN